MASIVQTAPQLPANHNRNNGSRDDRTSSSADFQLTIPSIVREQGKRLACMDQKVLSQCLQPVFKSLEDLDAEALLNLERVPEGARLCDGVNVRPIHDDVYPKYENGGTAISCVRYIHISEVKDQYSIGIFVFPPFARIPLHDHPGMCVLSRLLYGDLQKLSLDLPEKEEEAPTPSSTPPSVFQHPYQAFCEATNRMFAAHPPNSQPSSTSTTDAATVAAAQALGLPEGSRRAYKNEVTHLHAPGVSMLFPYEGNLHEFFAGPNGAAVLDILLPPYDDEHDRDCTFYDIQEDMRPPSMMMDVDPSSMASHVVHQQLPAASSQDDDRATCWLVPTTQPSDFHCLSGKYQQLGASANHTQDL